MWTGARGADRAIDLSVDVKPRDILVVVTSGDSNTAGMSADDTWLGDSDGDIPVMINSSTVGGGSVVSVGFIRPTIFGSQTLRAYVADGSVGQGVALAVQGYDPNVILSSDQPLNSVSSANINLDTDVTTSDTALLGGLAVGLFNCEDSTEFLATPDMETQHNTTDGAGRLQIFSNTIRQADIPTFVTTFTRNAAGGGTGVSGLVVTLDPSRGGSRVMWIE